MGSEFGEMQVFGTPPEPLRGPLAVIGRHLHSLYDRQPGVTPGASRSGCIFSALTVRDFLHKTGFADATVASVIAVLIEAKNNEPVYKTALGLPPNHGLKIKGKWFGHLVTVIPSAGYLIDATLFHAPLKPKWRGPRGVIALPLATGDAGRYLDRDIISGVRQDLPDGTSFHLMWLDNAANNTWLKVDDANSSRRRQAVANAMCELCLDLITTEGTHSRCSRPPPL